MPFIKPGSGGELLKEDMAAIQKLKSELAEATSSLNFALEANMDLANRNKDLELRNEAAKGEVLELKRIVESLRTENDVLQERCLATQEKEKAVACQVDVLSEDVIDLGQKMIKLTLDIQEEWLLRVKAEKDLYELQGFVITQHDLGFDRAVRQATFFYQVPVDEGKFDHRKYIYKGELTSVMDIPDEDEEVEAHSETSKASGDLSTPIIIISD